MKGVKMLKIVGWIIITMLLGLIQVTWTVFAVNGVMPNLMLMLVVTISFFEVKNKTKPRWTAFSVAWGGGLLLDFFSSLPLGTEALLLVGLSLGIKQILKLLENLNFSTYLILFFILFVIYHLIWNIITGSFNFPGWLLIIHNLFLATLFYLVWFLFQDKTIGK